MTPEILLALCVATGLYMAWSIGANDVANAMGTSVGSGALSFRGAVVAAAIFEFAGAVLVGAHVTDTVRKGIVDASLFAGDPMLLAIGMTAALLAAAAWLHLASYLGWPVSTTHSIVGAVAGFGLAAHGMGAIHGGKLAVIAASWVVSPLMGAAIAWAVFLLVRGGILDAARPLDRLRMLGPWLGLPVFAILTLSLFYKGLKNLHLDLPLWTALALSLGVGLVAAGGIALWMRRVPRSDGRDVGDELQLVERHFALLQIVTACYVAFAHGSNDVANAVGPMAAVVGVVRQGVVGVKVDVPVWALVVGAAGIVVGLATYGRNVIRTVGEHITAMTPTRGFAAEFGAATTILVGSKLGLPISTTHTLVGAVIGVGLARGIAAIDVAVVRRIVMSWLLTLPVAAVLTALLYYLATL